MSSDLPSLCVSFIINYPLLYMPEFNPYEAPQTPLATIDAATIALPGSKKSQRVVLVLFGCQLLAALLTWVCADRGIFPILTLLAAATFLVLLVILLICGINFPSLKLLAIETLFLILTIKLGIEIWEALGEL